MNNKEALSSLTSSSKSTIPKRLFFAIWLDDDVIQHIQNHILEHFKRCQGRSLDKNNWHITLAYFGAADINTQACLEQHAEKIKSQPFELNLSKCGFWPRPKVAWLAPQEIPTIFKQLTAELQQAIRPCGFKPEIRDYLPHITLVRKAKHEPSLLDVPAINFKVSKFCLVESKTSSEGALYAVLKSWDL